MAIERLVGLFVTNDDLYQKYREKMYPILQRYEGDFGYDFQVSEVLKKETNEPINRVFTMHFKTEESLNGFFADKNYLHIRNTYFEPAVSAVTVISTYPK